jgi:putative FmdB family regulatory protein
MSVYVCICSECGYHFEMLSSMRASQVCPACGSSDFEVLSVSKILEPASQPA